MARISLHVTPGAREDAVVGWYGDSLRLTVRARPEKGLANEAVLRLVAERLGLPRTSLTVVRGAASRRKLLEVDGLSEGQLRKLLGPTPPR